MSTATQKSISVVIENQEEKEAPSMSPDLAHIAGSTNYMGSEERQQKNSTVLSKSTDLQPPIESTAISHAEMTCKYSNDSGLDETARTSSVRGVVIRETMPSSDSPERQDP